MGSWEWGDEMKNFHGSLSLLRPGLRKGKLLKSKMGPNPME